MLSVRLVRMIEDHAEELTRAVLNDLQSNTRTWAYHKICREELHRRVYEVYHNVGERLGPKTDEMVEARYSDLGQKRRAEAPAGVKWG